MCSRLGRPRSMRYPRAWRAIAHNAALVQMKYRVLARYAFSVVCVFLLHTKHCTKYTSSRVRAYTKSIAKYIVYLDIGCAESDMRSEKRIARQTHTEQNTNNTQQHNMQPSSSSHATTSNNGGVSNALRRFRVSWFRRDS